MKLHLWRTRCIYVAYRLNRNESETGKRMNKRNKNESNDRVITTTTITKAGLAAARQPNNITISVFEQRQNTILRFVWSYAYSSSDFCCCGSLPPLFSPPQLCPSCCLGEFINQNYYNIGKYCRFFIYKKRIDLASYFFCYVS